MRAMLESHRSTATQATRPHVRRRWRHWVLIAAVASTLLVVAALNDPRSPAQSPPLPLQRLPDFVASEAVERLAAALRFETVSQGLPARASETLPQLHEHLERSFPLVHATLARERVSDHSLLFTWPGRNPQAPAVLLMAHQDVVPASIGTGRWSHPPFSGTVTEGYIWGRGAVDDKGPLMAQLEAVESFLRQGLRPERTLYLAFGHDEEKGGEAQGARAIAALLRSRGVKLHYVLDEGLLVSDGVIAGTRRPVALIGVAEKGFATIRLRATTEPGHSSMPPQRSAIGKIGRAVAALESHPMPARLEGVAGHMFAALAPEMAVPRRWMLANLWLTAPLVKRALEQSPATNAMLRTTAAVTVIRGGVVPNVLPSTAEALVNFRLLPGDSADDVLAHVRRVVLEEDVEADMQETSQAPSGISPHDTASYRAIRSSITDAFGDVAVVPGLVVGGTDARHMTGLTDQVYRFSPVRARREDLTRIHGDDERLSLSNYVEMIRFYQRLLWQTVLESNASQLK